MVRLVVDVIENYSMKISRKLRFLTLLLGVIVLSSHAQEVEDTVEPAAPGLESLGSDWWTYFEGPRDDVESRIDGFLDDIAKQVARLQGPNEAVGQSVLDAVRDNLGAYQALLAEDELELLELPTHKLSHSLDDLLRFAAVSRAAREGAAQEQLEVEREQRILDGATRRRDLAFKDYVVAETGDARLLAALKLIQTRSAQAIAARRLELLTQSYERAKAHAEATAERVVLAGETLATTLEDADLGGLIEGEANGEAAVAKAQEDLRAAELAATGLDLDTEQGRSQQRLMQQKLVEANVVLAISEVMLAQTQARRWWTELQLDTDPDLDLLEEQALKWSELVRGVEQDVPNWQRDTQDELLAVQSVDQEGMNRASRRLLDQRLGTAQETLTGIGELEAAVADLQLLRLAVDGAAADYSGALRSWLSGLSRRVKTSYMRVVGLADVTLFSVGEAPVTGRDIFRVLIILIVALLVSRGVRFAIRRFSEKDSGGTQASLYTVGRLTHYLIIVTAVFVALSSIGLDFRNLALVAGALSVGIGFGLQSIVGNFVSGLVILFEHTLRVGDYIELDTGLTGTVKAINVRSTLINTNDNIDIVVPNSEFVTTRLTNWTLGERVLRVRIPFGVAYGSDKELVREAALEAVAEVPYTLKRKGREPDVWLVDFADSSLNFLLLVWVNTQGARRPTRTRAAYLWALESKLTEYGIEIPFPQRDVHVRSGLPVPEQPIEDQE
jgi:small-conductance mechanosensitive channel